MNVRGIAGGHGRGLSSESENGPERDYIWLAYPLLSKCH
jgi:hypothetical protein